MSATSNIEWTDSTFNPWIGCTKVSPACDHCYAAVSRPTRAMKIEWGAGKLRHRTAASTWKLPERWNRNPFYECYACDWRGDNLSEHRNGGCETTFGLVPARRRVFSASLADWLDNEIPIEWLVDFLDLVRRTPNLDWLLLTKRIGNLEYRLTQAREHLMQQCTGELIPALRALATSEWIKQWLDGEAPANVWIGATVINQAEADRDVPKLLAVPARVRFLSIEPMLGPIDLRKAHMTKVKLPRVDWVIVGGESGPKARPMHPDWVRSLRDQCAAAGVPFLFKQWGEFAPNYYLRDDGSSDESTMWIDRMGKKAAGRKLDGVEYNGFPDSAA